MVPESPSDRRWKFPVIPFIIGKMPAPLPDETVAQLGSFYVPDIADVVGRMYTVANIHSFVEPAIPVVGTALTVKCPPGDNLGLKKALTMVEPGNVIVVDAQGFSEWCLGGFQMLRLAIRDRGLKGLIVHGAYRDASEARAAGFPIYAAAQATWSGPKIGSGEINVPVCCGGVIVHPGDVICASGDGIVVVPRQYADHVASHLTKAVEGRSDDIFSSLAKQNSATDAYLDVMKSQNKLVNLGDV